MDYNTFLKATEQGQQGPDIDVLSASHALEQIRGGRKKRGVR